MCLFPMCYHAGCAVQVDGYVGAHVIAEDEIQRTWNFTLCERLNNLTRHERVCVRSCPGCMTSMHRHDYDYSFVAVKPSQLEVYGEDGKRLFDFYATGVLFLELLFAESHLALLQDSHFVSRVITWSRPMVSCCRGRSHVCMLQGTSARIGTTRSYSSPR
jgi:hypothetical protein